jgi:NAD(P)-dependent dehydrogenase (short-subunit alcohol dehydrogenase family)
VDLHLTGKRVLITGASKGIGPAAARAADAMVFLASNRSAYTSGVILTIDGGLCAASGQ